ncbi:MAG: DUF1653 domain-containing protein [Lachnospiraceae bacterium]|nr:DUF1653 domain-containing protein [Lachnospiraceae bacterium]
MNKRPVSGELYRHFKGGLYQIVCIAKHSETEEEMVIYQAMYGDFSIYVRPLSMFMSEVSPEKYPESRQKYRFEKTEITEKVTESETEKATWKETKPVTDILESDNEEMCDPNLLAFLEADSSKEKKNILMFMKDKIDDRMINDIAASLDIVVDEGDIEQRIASIINCLNTMSKYECDRFS